jgi:uncharacterized membrane protein
MDLRRRIEPTFESSQAATPVAIALSVDRQQQAARPRLPRGLAVIAVLAIVGGLAGVAFQLYAYRELAVAFDSLGLEASLTGWTLLIFSLLAMVGGGLTFDGSKWGWMIIVALVTLEGVAAIQALMLVHSLEVDLALMSGTTISPYTKYAGRLLLDALVIIYLFRWRVRTYFRLTPWQAWGLLCVVLSVTVVAVLYQGAPPIESGELNSVVPQ